MTKPTRGEVETFIAVLPKLSVQMIEEDWVLALAKAYLAQEEELKRVWKLVKYQDEFIMEKSKDAADRLQEINRLEAENQALRDANTYLHEQLDKAVNT